MSGKAPKEPKAAKAEKPGKAPKGDKPPGGFGLWMTAFGYGLMFGGVVFLGWRFVGPEGATVETVWPWVAGGFALFLAMLSNIAAGQRA